MTPVVAPSDRVYVICEDGRDARRKDHGEAVVVDEFRDFWLLDNGRYQFTVHKWAVFCGQAALLPAGLGRRR